MQETKEPIEILKLSLNKALGSGISGASAMVTGMMWMRTIMNFQYRNGISIKETIKLLYREEGIRRFYRGYFPALFQAPLSRFGDTAANVGVLEFMKSHELTKNLPTFIQTLCASITAASWRIFLMPIDASKTSLQVHGAGGLKKLANKVRVARSPSVLYHGSLAACTATFVGHFPWFFTFNTLDEHLPKWDSSIWTKLGRRAMMGFISSVVSDTISNSIRVVKTFKQTSPLPISYPASVKTIYNDSGLLGLLGRGLKIRIIANGTQGLVFAILWRGIMDIIEKRNKM